MAARVHWQNYENWQLGGARDATQRETDILEAGAQGI